MKKCVFIIALILGLVSSLMAQPHQAGDKAILFEASMFSNLSLNNVNGGFGFEVFLGSPLALQGTLGFVAKEGTNLDQKSFNTSGAVLLYPFSTDNTNFYLGPEIFYQHLDPNLNTFQFGGLLGVSFMPWHNISLAGQYSLGIQRSTDPATGNGVTTWTFGATDGKIILGVWI